MGTKFTVIFIFCFILSSIDLMAHSYNISMRTISDRSTRINSQHEPIILCGPDDASVPDCSNPQFTHNSSLIDPSVSKYSTTFNSFNKRATLRVHNVVPSDAGSYRCRYTCGTQYTYADSLTLIFVPPIIFLVPRNTTYHQYVGSNVTLHCSALHYDLIQWQTSNSVVIQPLAGKYHFQGLNLTIVNVSADDEGSYFCAANNLIVVRLDIEAVLKVYMKPTTTAVSNVNITVFEGNTTTFKCIATAIPRPHIIWSNDNDLTISGRIQKEQKDVGKYGLSSNLTISFVQRSDQGKYKCAGGNDNGTSTVIFTLTVIIPPTPSLKLNLEAINSSSISVSWTISGVSLEENVTIVWSTTDGVIINIKVVSQDSSPVIIPSLQSNTSYIFKVTVSSLNNSLNITTNPEEPIVYYSSTQMRDIISTSSVIPNIFVSQSISDFLSFDLSTTIAVISSATKIVSSSLTITATPTTGGIISNNVTFGIGIACSIAFVLILAVIIVSVSVCLVIRTKRWSKKTLNIQSIDKQNSIRSDCQLLEETKGYPTQMSGVSLNSLHNGRFVSPSYAEEFQEMTVNPYFGGSAALSQESASVYNTCSSCPPFPGKVHDNVYHIESYDCQDFEMTDNPYYDNDISRPNYVHASANDSYTSNKWISGNDFDSASQQMSYKSPNDDSRFEFNENSNYECTPVIKSPVSALQYGQAAVYSSDMSLSRTQSPRFQIVNEKRGNIREEVNLVKN